MWNLTALWFNFMSLLAQPVVTTLVTTTPAPLPAESIVANRNYTTENLVREVFVGGACRNTFNIKSIGSSKGIGYFEKGLGTIGLNRGVILATGSIENCQGPNDSRRAGEDFNDSKGDPDLGRYTSAQIKDAVGLEFDFTPLDSIVTFRYVFASEEYCEFVGSTYNDVFGFFVSGPGINGTFSDNSINVALVPGTNDYVSINNVNHKVNSQYYVGNELKDDAERCAIPWKGNPPNLGNIQYDGFTKVMTATLKLRPCEVYHLRLVISDVDDGRYDSAVFLDAESFNIGGAVTLSVRDVGVQADSITEGCKGSQFVLARQNPEQVDIPITIGIKVSNASTAKEGEDFKTLPDSVTIPAGQKFVTIPIESYADPFNELSEDVILELDFPCACISDTARLFLTDPAPLRTGLRDLEACLGDTVKIMARPGGGTPNYRYRWSTGDTISTIRSFWFRDTAYRIKILDACGLEIEEPIRVKRRKPPEARLTTVREVCLDDTVALPVNFLGSGPFEFTYTTNGQDPKTVKTFENPYFIRTGIEGKYELIKFKDAVCEGTVLGRGELRNFRLQTIPEIKKISCFGARDGEIKLSVSGGTAPYVFNWSSNLGTGSTIGNLALGNFKVKIVDANNCFIEQSFDLDQPEPLLPIKFDCREFNGQFISYAAEGGSAPYTYSVNNGPFEGESLFETLVPGQRYALKIQDSRGCAINQDFLMPARYRKMVELPQSLTVGLGENFSLKPLLNIPASLVKTVTWTPSEGLSCSDCVNPNLAALRNNTYIIRVEDVFGCSASAFVNVKLDRALSIFIPGAFSPNGDGLNDLLSVYANTKQVRLVKSLEVYDRWGQLLYRDLNMAPNDDRRGWDGKVRGELMPPGAYLYKAVLELVDGQSELKIGEIMLMR
jgi:gliding motility-associated-like protein